MAENFESKPLENEEKTRVSDTGSAKIISSEAEIDPNQPNSEENISKTEEAKENKPKTAENKDKALNLQSNTLDFFNNESKTAFSKDFPDVDIEKLRESEHFQAFLSILTKNPTLSEVYACFNSIFASAEEKSEKKLLQALANATSGVGALSTSNSAAEPYFTREQVLKMTPEQIKRNYTQIRKSQARW